MKTQPGQLPQLLKKGLASVYLISGDEPLLVQECCDQVRKAAKDARVLRTFQSKNQRPEQLAIEIADAVAKGAPELVSAPLNARVAIWLRACWPAGLFWYMAKKA